MKKQKEVKEKSAAILTIFGVRKMTKEGRRDIANWLHRQAKFLQDYPNQYAPRFTARYLYKERK